MKGRQLYKTTETLKLTANSSLRSFAGEVSLVILRLLTCMVLWPCFAGVATAAVVDLNAGLREAVTQHPDIRSRRDEQQAAVDRLDAARWGRFLGLSAEVETRSGGPQPVMC
jgi:hypothetical protein